MKGDNKLIGQRIRELRGELTQVDFAKLLGTSQGTIAKYEKGTKPDIDILLRISRHTGRSIEWVMTGEKSREMSNPHIENVIRMMEQMDDEAQKDVCRLVEKEKLLRDLIKEKQKKGDA